ncbi:MAG: P-loop NTPase, partial [Campylobacterales bacterium]|nr:P-loop NTPase [Campylobacterales bacterium]
ESDIFGMGTSAPVAMEYGTELIARIPIEPAIRIGGDTGKPVTYHQPDSETAKRYQEAASKVLAFIDKVNAEGGVSNQAIQPTTPPGVSACSTSAGAASAPAKEHSHKHEHNNGPDGGCCGGGCH